MDSLGGEKNTAGTAPDQESQVNKSVHSQAKWNDFGAALVLLLVSVLPFWHAGYEWEFLGDDTYITLTYAKNLAAGRGFVYNYPPPTFGSTTPLLVLSAAALAKAIPWIELSKLATYFTACCWVGVAWLFFVFRRTFKISAWQATTIGATLLMTSYPARLGMESFLFQFLMVLAIVLAMAKRWFWSGLTVGLLYLTRGEGILVLPCIALVTGGQGYYAEQRSSGEIARQWRNLVLGAAIPIVLWSVYAHLTFGQILPNTLYAKHAHTALTAEPTFDRLWIRIMKTWAQYYGAKRATLLNYVSWVFAIMGLVVVFRRKREWLVFLAFFVAYVAGYSILHVRVYTWYRTPMFFVWQVHLGLGLYMAARWLSQAPGQWRLCGKTAGAALVASLCIYTTTFHLEWTPTHSADRRATIYLKICEWLRNNTEPGSTVARTEVGYVGYFTDNKIIDLFGLVTPDMLPYLAINDRTSGFWKHQPDYYVCPFSRGAGGGFSRINRMERFDEEYEPVARITGPPPHKLYVIFKRKDKAAIPDE